MRTTKSSINAARRALVLLLSAVTALPAGAQDLRQSYRDSERFYELSPSASAFPADGAPWISQMSVPPANPAPLAVTPTDAGVTVRTSLGQMRDYNAQLTANKIEAAKLAAPSAGSQVSAPAAPKSRVNVWSSYDVQGIDGSVEQSSQVGVGADYKASPHATFGVAAERGQARVAGVAQEDHMLAAYAAFRAAPTVTIDARTQWRTAESAASLGSTENGTISIAPRIAQPFTLQSGDTIEPFVSYTHAFDIGSSGLTSTSGDAATQSAGAGVTFAKPDAYSLSLTTDIEGVGANEPANVNSRLQLSVPIR
ncbi:MAG: hypothetical protein ACT4OU_00250 [Hyphomicrobium sp.]